MKLSRLIKPDVAPVVRLGQTVVSYAELDDTSARVAAFLGARGVVPDDRVGVMLDRVAELPGVFYGVLRAGAVVVPVDVRSSQQEVAARLAATGARVVFAWHRCLDVAEAGARDAEATHVVVHPASFRALLDEVVPRHDDVERAPQDLAVLLQAGGGGEAVALTHAELADRVLPLTAEDARC